MQFTSAHESWRGYASEIKDWHPLIVLTPFAALVAYRSVFGLANARWNASCGDDSFTAFGESAVRVASEFLLETKGRISFDEVFRLVSTQFDGVSISELKPELGNDIHAFQAHDHDHYYAVMVRNMVPLEWLAH